MITPQDQLTLLALARQALEARVRRVPVATPLTMTAGELLCGAFVSIHRHGELRGCLGRIETDWPLGRVVAHLAGAVADSDPRFDPVLPDEIGDLEIEISVLTPEREIQSIDEIVVGQHGLIIEDGARRGLLLPQVPAEHGWDRLAFLEHLCIKAGLPPNAWQRGARLFVFEAQVFSECEQRERAPTD